jgi:chorismate mutase/GNAT superfamily N-acetyltransferase
MPTDPELMLRPAVADDIPLLVQVMRAAREAAPMPDLPYTDREVGAHLAARLTMDEMWVADDGDGPVGFARLTGTWLDDLYVVPEGQRSGVGSALLDLAKALRPEGFGLWVFASNVPARAFYARHGLLELESTDGATNDEGAPDLRMVWAGEEPLSYLRAQIDEVDDELAVLLARRTALTAAVQEIKPVGGPAGRDPGREQRIAERIAPKVPLLSPEAVRRIVHTIITESLDADR